MIKRLRKFRKSKQGAILIIVVLILALAMIFIASAMMLTQATRGRLYKNTMSSQARLTVTTAAEVFLEALETQEITDAQLDTMLDASHTGMQRHDNLSDRMKMIVDGVPGMQGVDGNCTYLDLYYPSTSNHNVVYADFTTVIGEEVENVRAVLKVNEQKSNAGGRFSNQIEIAANVGTSELRFTEGVGMYNPAVYSSSPDDNTILMRSDSAHEQTSGSIFFSDLIFGGSNGIVTELGGGNAYHGDMIFMEGSYFGTISSFTVIDGDMYFLGTKKEASFRFNTANSWGKISNDTKIVFQAQYAHENPDDESSPLVYSGRYAQDSSQNKTGVDDTGYIRDLFNDSSTGGYGSANRAYYVSATGGTVAVSEADLKLSTYGSSGTAYTVSSTSDGFSDVSGRVAYFNNLDGNGYNLGSFPGSASEVFSEVKFGSMTLTTPVTLDVDTTSPDGSKTYSAGTPIPAGEPFIPPLTTSFPDYATKNIIDLTSLSSSLNKTNRVVSLDPGFYYITGTGATVWDAEGEHPGAGAVCPFPTKPDYGTAGVSQLIFAIDGSKAEQYRFYFAGNTKFDLAGVVFAIYNAQNTNNNHSCIFVLEEGAEVTLGNANNKLNADEHVLCSSGFISINRATTASALKTYITSHSYYDECIPYSTKWYKGATQPSNLTDANVIKYSSKYDSKNRPAMFIYGAGSNKFKCENSSIVEAYVGLYGNSCFGIAESVSTIIPIYGRVEANYFENGNSGGDHPLGEVQMPYCPKPKTDDTKPPKRTAGSKYSVFDMIYYYE